MMRRRLAAAVVLATMVAACGDGGSTPEVAARASSTTTAAPETTTTVETVETTTPTTAAPETTTTVAVVAPASVPPSTNAPRPPTTAAPRPATTAAPAPSSTSAKVPTVSPSGTPAWNDDAPDPQIVRFDGTWWAYSTGTTWGNNLGVLQSSAPDRGWVTTTGRPFGSTALGAIPSWQEPGTQWAPGVFAHGGRYVMWYAAKVKATGRWCISVAVASAPKGPFNDSTTRPTICQPDGSIDPQPFTDADGRPWLHWKNNDELSDTVSKVWAVPLGPDGTTLAGNQVEILAKNSQRFPWQTTVDNPQMVLVDGTYYLFHTGGDYQGNESYTVGYATCAGPAGPCTTQPKTILSSYGTVVGPGGGTVAQAADGQWWMSYHAWTSGCTRYECGGKRKLYVAPLTFR